MLLVPGEAVLQWSGELWPLDRVFAHQHAHPDALYLRATDQVFCAYTCAASSSGTRSVIVAGSSRTMKFRAEMFGDRATGFYNAGGMINSLRDLHEFCLTLPSTRTPAVLLLGVDLWWFNDDVEVKTRFLDHASTDTNSFDEHVIGLRWLLGHPRSFAAETIALPRGAGDRLVGIAAREGGGGFRLRRQLQAIVPTPRSDAEWRFVDLARCRDHRARQGVCRRPIFRRRTVVLGRGAARSRRRAFGALREPACPRGSAICRRSHRRSSPGCNPTRRHSRLWADFEGTIRRDFRTAPPPLLGCVGPGPARHGRSRLSDGFHAEETFQLHVLDALLRDARVRAALPGTHGPSSIKRSRRRETNYWEPDFGGRR